MRRHHIPKHALVRALPRDAYAVPPDPRASWHEPTPGQCPLVQSKPMHKGAGKKLKVEQASVFNGKLVATVRAPDKTGNSNYRHPSKRAGMRAGRCVVTTYYEGVQTWSNTKAKG